MMIRVLLYLAIIVQFVAMYYAIRLVRLTKYNAIWFLFIIGFVVLAAERLLQLWMSYGNSVSIVAMVWCDIVVSVCISAGIVLLDRLFVYINRLNRHRQLTEKRILTAVLRAEEKTRSTFSKELHDGLGPLLSSAKISLSAIKREELDAERREIFDNTLYVVDEALRSLREISNNLSPHVLRPGAFNDELLTDKEVAHILKVSRRTLQDYRNNGILSYIQVGGKILNRTSDVQRTIMSGFKEAYRLRDSG